MMTLDIAKENLFKTKGLSYLEALQSKLELIKNQDKLELDMNLGENKYYLQYVTDDDIRIIAAERQ